MSAAALAAPAWSPDTHPVHRLIQLLDVLHQGYRDYAHTAARWLAAQPLPGDDQCETWDDPARHFGSGTVWGRLPYDHPLANEYFAVCRSAGRPLAALRERVAADDFARRLVVDFLTADAVAYMATTLPARYAVEPAVRRAVDVVNQLLTPELHWDYDALPDPYRPTGGAPAVVADWLAKVRGGLVQALAEAGERIPAEIGCRRAIRSADLAMELPSPWRPDPPQHAADEVEVMSPFGLTDPDMPDTEPDADPAVVVSGRADVPPDGPGPNHLFFFRGRPVKLTATQYRVVAFLWERDWIGFDALAAHVNAHRPHATPTVEGFKTWVSRGNKALAEVGYTRRLRVDAVNRVISWEPVPVVTPAEGGFSPETADETAVTPG